MNHIGYYFRHDESKGVIISVNDAEVSLNFLEQFQGSFPLFDSEESC